MSPVNLHPQARPWWTFGYVWMVAGGPLAVVVASFLSFYVAANGQDPVLSTTQEVTAPAPGAGNALAPAMQARNHAATGTLPSKP